MPTLRHSINILARGVKVFLDLEVGIVRGATELGQGGQSATHASRAEDGEIERLRGLLTERERQISSLRARGEGVEGVRPENLVWIFGTGRSGNTWLSSMMGDMRGHATWGEPRVGMLFGEFYFVNSFEGQRKSNNFILGEGHRGTWLGSIRSFVLEGVRSRFPTLSEEGYLTIKEQVGSIGAPLLMEALPESCMILLIRDPRDVVASWMDASRKGAWHHERRKDLPGWTSSADEDPNSLVKERAERYLKQVGTAKVAFDAHEGPKVLVRYEELRADALGTMRRLYSTLGVPVDEGELARVVDKHSWENIAQEKRGEGKFYRKAQPGGWREDLTPEQAATVQKVTAPLLREFYPPND